MMEFSHPYNLIGPLNFFQAHEDCDQFRIANGTSPPGQSFVASIIKPIATIRTRVASLYGAYFVAHVFKYLAPILFQGDLYDIAAI